MGKRVKHFVLVMLLLLVVAYIQPVFFPTKSGQKPSKQPEEIVTDDPSSFIEGEIESIGLSKYVGKTPAAFVQEYGEAIEIQDVDETKAWWIFGESSQDYFQLLIENNKIQSIFVLGENNVCDSFSIGMSLDDILSITTIYSNFSFEFKGEDYVVELSEYDMQTQPLVAFDNETYAILHINQINNKLIGVRYVNEETLLKLMPYSLQKGHSPFELPDNSQDNQVNAVQQARQFYSVLNVLREQSKSEMYTPNEHLQEASDGLLTTFMQNKEDILSEERMEKLAEIDKSGSYQEPFYLEKDESNKLTKLYKTEVPEAQSLFFAPTQDIPFMVMNWYGRMLEQFPINAREYQEVGLSFKENYVMILIATSNNEEIKESSTMDSEKVTNKR